MFPPLMRPAAVGVVAGLAGAAIARAEVWVETARLAQPAPGSLDRFGWSIDVDGDVLVVGAMEEQHVYVFRRDASGWQLEQEIAAPPLANAYASAVAIDGDRFVVGAPASSMTRGRAWVYVRAGSVWSLEAELAGADVVAFDSYFGASVAIDGDRIAVGAPGLGDLGPNSGAAYVFERSGGAWTQAAKLLDASGSADDGFGGAVALRADTLVVGAPDDDGLTPYSGTVHVFTYAAPSWSQGQTLLPVGAASPAQFGAALAIDGPRLLACAGFGVGYVFRETGGTWAHEGTLWGSGIGPAGATFGWSVALDGDRALVGSMIDANFAGSVYVFAFDGSTWSEEARLVLADAVNGDFFGCSVALQGGEAFVGAWGRDGPGDWTGLAVVFGHAPPGGVAYCPGDGSAGPCPCQNESTPGLGQGCRHSGGHGATLHSLFSASVALDDLVLVGGGMLPSSMALLGAGPTLPALATGFPSGGDGLRCIGGSVRRAGMRPVDVLGSAQWGPGLALAHGFAAGETWNFQVWYRDPTGGPCGSAFNTTNALRVVWTP